MTYPHRWAGAILLLVLAFIALAYLPPAIQSWGRAPQQIADLPGKIVGQVTPLIDKHAERIEDKAQAEIRHGVNGALSAVREIGATADARVLSIQEQADMALNDLVQVTEKQLTGMRSDLKPTLDNSAALVKDAQDSLDDMYWDVKAMVGSATVLTTSAARASEAVEKEVPKLSKAATSTSESIAGIMSDAHAWTDKNVRPRPMTWKEKVAAVFKLAFAAALAALRGGAF